MFIGMNLGIPTLGGVEPWYLSNKYKLNGVAPTLIHDYATNNYWNSIAGTHTFPFNSVRTGNATMFDSSGRLVWAPANMIAQSSVSGAAIGVIGSGGSLPTGWAWSSVGSAALTREVVGIGEDYIDIRLSGSNNSGSAVFPGILIGGVITAVIGAPITGSVYMKLVSGSFDGITYANCGKFTVQFSNSGAFVSSLSPSSLPTSTISRLTASGSRETADHNEWRAQLILALNDGDTCDLTIRISQPQIERTGPDSPKPYNLTTGTAYYGPRISYDPHTGKTGALIEFNRTNLAPKSNTNSSFTAMSVSTGATALGWVPERITADGTANPHFVAYTAVASAPTGSTIYTISALVKIISGSRLQLTASTNYANTTDYVNFNLSSGTVVGSGGTVVASSITSCGSGYYRISMTFTTIGSPAVGSPCILSCITGDADTRIPSNSSSDVFDVIGVQMELGYGVSSFIPTYYASATRPNDILITTSVSWLNQSLGTWYVEFTPSNSLDILRRIVSISDGSANNIVSCCHTTSKKMQIHSVLSSSGDFTPMSAGNAEVFTTSKVALRLNSPSKSLCLNGGAVASASVAFPTSGYTSLQAGGNPSGSNYFGHINEIRYYPSASASDGQLQTLTT